MFASIADRLCDLRLNAHRIDGDDGTGQIEVFQQERKGGDSLDFSSVAYCPNTSRWPAAQTENRCKGLRLFLPSWPPRGV
jgi:hypothetical protein